MQREDVLGQALQLLEIQGIASTTLEMVADRIDYPLDELRRFWPDKEALLYDALRYLSQPGGYLAQAVQRAFAQSPTVNNTLDGTNRWE